MSLGFRRNCQRHCSRCGQPLEDPASEELGIGPICRKKNNTLLSRTIPANTSCALAIVLGMPQEGLPEACKVRFASMVDLLLTKSEKAARATDDATVMDTQGQDFRSIIKEIDWMLSFRMNSDVRSNLIQVVKYLGYVELAGVLSQEASTTPAKLWMENGRIFLLGKRCKMGFLGMKEIKGITLPRKNQEEPYSAPCSQVEPFLNVVKEFWPLYEPSLSDGSPIELEAIVEAAQAWAALHPLPVSSLPSMAGSVVSVKGLEGGWTEVSFPWIKGKNDSMYSLVNRIKESVKYSNRKYNPNSKTWAFKESVLPEVLQLLRDSNLFEDVSSLPGGGYAPSSILPSGG